MQRLLAALAAMAAAGCSTLTPQDADRTAGAAADWELCYFTATGRGPELMRQAVRNQMAARRVDCNQHAAMMQARAAADGARINQSLQMIQLGTSMMARPGPTTTAPVVCTSTAVLGSIQTICK